MKPDARSLKSSSGPAFAPAHFSSINSSSSISSPRYLCCWCCCCCFHYILRHFPSENTHEYIERRRKERNNERWVWNRKRKNILLSIFGHAIIKTKMLQFSTASLYIFPSFLIFSLIISPLFIYLLNIYTHTYIFFSSTQR